MTTFYPYDWTTASCVGSNCTWNATSPFGAVTANSTNGWRPGGTGGTNFTPLLNNEFSVFGLNALITITLPTGLNWGPNGGELIFGNVHNGFAYNISATDGTNPIDVNTWTVLGEDPNSTSSTSLCVGGTTVSVPTGACAGASTSLGLYVLDLGASIGSGQGGIVALGGLPSSVRTITVELVSNNLGNVFPTGGQGSDFILLNVGGSPVPEPSTAALALCGCTLVLLRHLRQRRLA